MNIKKKLLFFFVFLLFSCSKKIEDYACVDMNFERMAIIKIKISDTLVARLLDSAEVVHPYKRSKNGQTSIYKNHNWRFENYWGKIGIHRKNHHIFKIITSTYLDNFAIEQIKKLSHLKDFSMERGTLDNPKLYECFEKVQKAKFFKIKFPNRKIIIDKKFSNVKKLIISDCDFDEIVFDKDMKFEYLEIYNSKDEQTNAKKIVNIPKVDTIRCYNYQTRNDFIIKNKYVQIY